MNRVYIAVALAVTMLFGSTASAGSRASNAQYDTNFISVGWNGQYQRGKVQYRPFKQPQRRIFRAPAKRFFPMPSARHRPNQWQQRQWRSQRQWQPQRRWMPRGKRMH